MRRLISYLILIPSILFGQAIVTNPEFPTENNPIEIIFDITQMTGRAVNLVGYTGTLYAHTGVYTNLNSSSWQYVIESWGDNTTQPSLTRIGTDLYQLIIDNPRAFYGITNTAEHIISINLVLRSADASKQTEDLFVAIYDDGFNIKLLDIESIDFYPLPNQRIDITAVTNGADSLRVYLDNVLISQTTDDTLSFSFLAAESGRQWLKYHAYGNDNIFKDSVSFISRDNLIIEELPAGIIPGINYIDNNTVTLALYAPNKKFVYTIGDFNNWEFDQTAPPSWLFDDKYYFKLTPDSSVFWITLNDLTPSVEYRFQYLVDGKLRIADPFSDKILEQEDSFITDATYPNLIPYPTGKTFFSVSVLETGQPDFEWESIDYVKPKKENLIIYELLIRDFVAEHDYKTLIDTLDYLNNLGINAIELMPVNEFEGNESWGYNPSFYFAPDKYYGPKNDLKRFIDECHKRDIAVILDIVLNHSYGRSSFVRLYSSGDFGPPTEENPWYNVISPNPVFSWGYDFNHESEETKQLVDRINKYWLEEYNFDGFRFDFTKGFTNTPGDGGSFDQSRINILKRMADSVWAFDSTAYLILEHFAPDTEEKILTDYGMMVWGNNNYNYNEAAMGYHDSGKSNFSRISYKNHGFTNPYLVGYMESHDEERLMYKSLIYGNSSGNYNITELNTALNRIKLAAAFFITVPGPKMIWQFGELGYDYSINYNDRVGNKPIRWDYLDNVNRKNLYKTFSALNFLKNNYEVFSTTNFALDVSSELKRIQLSHETMNAVIIGNFDVVKKSISPSFQNAGTWYNYFSGDSIGITDTQILIPLKPGEFHIYTTVKLPTPEPNILTNVNTDEIKIPDKYELLQNYPNPFNPATIIRYSIPQTALNNNEVQSVILRVYDFLGRKIKTLVNEKQTPGNYSVNFNASDLSSGIYFYSLSTGNFTETKKMILLR
jgi:1,4-alpha-glucan branching enzyme